MAQETGMVRASALSAALSRPLGRVAVSLSVPGAVSLALLFLFAGIAVAADGAKPEAVTRVSVTKSSIKTSANKTKETSVKPAVCPPTVPGNTESSRQSRAESPDNSKSENNKNANGSGSSDLSVRLPGHEESGKNDGAAISGSGAAEDGGAESSDVEVRLKDKEMGATPLPSPAQCTVPSASQADEPPVPH